MPKAMTRSSAREDERVTVFIDGSNLYHVLGQVCGRHDLQFDKFASKLANGRDLRRVYYYNIRQEAFDDRSNASDQDKFLASLYDTPYLEVKLGIWKQRGSTMVEKGVDVMLATDLVTHAFRDQYDTAIVVSGDADFYPAMQAVKDVGKHIEVAAFDTNMSSEAARTTDVIIKLNKTYFTGLWTTRAQAQARSDASRKPEVTDEAASPNGEDKAATKSTSRRSVSGAGSRGRAGSGRSSSRSPGRMSGRGPGRSSSADENSRSRGDAGVKAAEHETETKPVEARQERPERPERPQERTPEPEPVSEERRSIRRTPSRRRVGGTASAGANGTAKPRPPALRRVGGNGTSEEGSRSPSETSPAPE